MGRTESGKTGVSTGLSLLSSTLPPALPPPGGIMERGGRSRDQREKGRKREAWPGTRGSRAGRVVVRKGEVGQWPVNHRHDVMTRLSFQRLHRRKSFVRSCLPLRLVPHPHAAVPPPPSLPPSLPSVTGRFLLVESIRWLQESGGFYC